MLKSKSSNAMTLLLVDDDPRLLNLLTVGLQISGFSVLTAGSPGEALAVMRQRVGDAVQVAVLDYRMPGTNGCVLADCLRSRYPRLKTILYSGEIDIPERDVSCVHAFVPKTGSLDPLLDKIAELTGDQNPASSPDLCTYKPYTSKLLS